jgi:hypothetical protein
MVWIVPDKSAEPSGQAYVNPITHIPAKSPGFSVPEKAVHVEPGTGIICRGYKREVRNMDFRTNQVDAAQPNPRYAHMMLRGTFCMCSSKVICFFAVLLAAALGLIFGAVYSAVILTALPAVIVFAVVMAVLIIALLIYRYCACCRSRKCE